MTPIQPGNMETKENQSLRLALVTETFPPEVNGVSRTLGRWVDTFRARGHEVQVIRPRQGAERVAPDLVAAWPLPFYKEVRLGLATRRELRGRFAHFKPDLVHVATPGPLGLIAVQVARRMRIPVVSSYHTNFDWYLKHYALGPLEPVLAGYLRWFHNATALTLVPSQSTRMRLAEQGYRNVEIWSRGIDTQQFHPGLRDNGLRRSHGLEENDILLLYVGRLAPEKGLPTLLDVFERLPASLTETRRIRLALVGGGPMASTLQARHLNDVHLAGFQEGTSLARWFASADVFVFPSLSETFGNVVLEAQASGLATVGFDCPTLRERIDSGVDGLLVPDRDGFARAVEQLCRDHEFRRRVGLAARARALRQDWDSIFDELEGRYLRCVARRSRTLQG
jgi:glycosyltransferase involved in cell wall biosynthesis